MFVNILEMTKFIFPSKEIEFGKVYERQAQIIQKSMDIDIISYNINQTQPQNINNQWTYGQPNENQRQIITRSLNIWIKSSGINQKQS